MIAVPAADARRRRGSWPAAAVRHVGRADVHRRIAPNACREPRRRARSAIPGLDWPWWPVAGAVVGCARRWRRRGAHRSRRRQGRSIGHAPPATRRPGRRRPRRTAGRRRPIARRGHARRAVGSASDRVRRQRGRAAARDHVRAGRRPRDLGGGLDDALDDWAAEVGTDDAGSWSACWRCIAGPAATFPHVLDQVAADAARTDRCRSRGPSAHRASSALGCDPRPAADRLLRVPLDDVARAISRERSHSPIGVAAIVIGVALEVPRVPVDPLPPGGGMSAVLWIGPVLSCPRPSSSPSGAILATRRCVLDGLAHTDADPRSIHRRSRSRPRRVGRVGAALGSAHRTRAPVARARSSRRCCASRCSASRSILAASTAPSRRRAAMDAQIPQLLDLLAAASSAGLSAQLALRRAVAALGGPLAAELGGCVRRGRSRRTLA